jgi:ADP-ribosylglycohydrolase
MIGAIAGDVIGAAHEFERTKTMDFPLFNEWSRFTDDTVMTVATAHALLSASRSAWPIVSLAADIPTRDTVARFFSGCSALTWSMNSSVVS